MTTEQVGDRTMNIDVTDTRVEDTAMQAECVPKFS